MRRLGSNGTRPMIDSWPLLNVPGFGFSAMSLSSSLAHSNGFAACLARSSDVSGASIGSQKRADRGRPWPKVFKEPWSQARRWLIGKANSDRSQ